MSLNSDSTYNSCTNDGNVGYQTHSNSWGNSLRRRRPWSNSCQNRSCNLPPQTDALPQHPRPRGKSQHPGAHHSRNGNPCTPARTGPGSTGHRNCGTRHLVYTSGPHRTYTFRNPTLHHFPQGGKHRFLAHIGNPRNRLGRWSGQFQRNPPQQVGMTKFRHGYTFHQTYIRSGNHFPYANSLSPLHHPCKYPLLLRKCIPHTQKRTGQESQKHLEGNRNFHLSCTHRSPDRKDIIHRIAENHADNRSLSPRQWKDLPERMTSDLAWFGLHGSQRKYRNTAPR